MVFTVGSSVWFTPGVVLCVAIGLFALCQLLHVLYVWAVGSGSLPFTCDSVDAEFDSIMYSCVHCVYVYVMFILHWCIVSIGYCLEYS